MQPFTQDDLGKRVLLELDAAQDEATQWLDVVPSSTVRGKILACGEKNVLISIEPIIPSPYKSLGREEEIPYEIILKYKFI